MFVVQLQAGKWMSTSVSLCFSSPTSFLPLHLFLPSFEWALNRLTLFLSNSWYYTHTQSHSPSLSHVGSHTHSLIHSVPIGVVVVGWVWGGSGGCDGGGGKVPIISSYIFGCCSLSEQPVNKLLVALLVNMVLGGWTAPQEHPSQCRPLFTEHRRDKRSVIQRVTPHVTLRAWENTKQLKANHPLWQIKNNHLFEDKRLSNLPAWVQKSRGSSCWGARDGQLQQTWRWRLMTLVSSLDSYLLTDQRVGNEV